jgi:hypothetical protein
MVREKFEVERIRGMIEIEDNEPEGTCHCGVPKEDHDPYMDGHGYVDAKCTCFYGDPPRPCLLHYKVKILEHRPAKLYPEDLIAT